jgi:hypothetical protein
MMCLRGKTPPRLGHLAPASEALIFFDIFSEFEFIFIFQINSSHPLKFFVEVKLNSIPVIEARVRLNIKVTRHQTNKENMDEFKMELFDNGNGDPDIRSNDGIYSRYFTEFSAGEGRYDIETIVDNDRGTAFTYQPTFIKGTNLFKIFKNKSYSSH